MELNIKDNEFNNMSTKYEKEITDMKVLHDDERIKSDNQLQNMLKVINDLNIIVDELREDLSSKNYKLRNMDLKFEEYTSLVDKLTEEKINNDTRLNNDKIKLQTELIQKAND